MCCTEQPLFSLSRNLSLCFFYFPFPLNKLAELLAVGADKAVLCRGSRYERRRCERRQLPGVGAGAAPLPPARPPRVAEPRDLAGSSSVSPRRAWQGTGGN